MAGMFNGKPWAENFREIPISRETGGKSLRLGNSRATGSSHILEAITFASGIQITIYKNHLKDHKILFLNMLLICKKCIVMQSYN